jgi:hypothetical protein
VIAVDAGVVLLDDYAVAPTEQEALVSTLATWADAVGERVAGFVSANIHRSLDGSRVANYAQWRSVRDIDVMRTLSEPLSQAELPAAESVLFELRHIQSATSQARIVEGSSPLTNNGARHVLSEEQNDLIRYLVTIAHEHSEQPGFVCAVSTVRWTELACWSSTSNGATAPR